MRNRKNKMLYYANILIAISFALFLYGLILDLSGESRLFDPIKDAKVIKGDDSGSHTSIYNSDENIIPMSKIEINNEIKEEIICVLKIWILI